MQDGLLFSVLSVLRKHIVVSGQLYPFCNLPCMSAHVRRACQPMSAAPVTAHVHLKPLHAVGIVDAGLRSLSLNVPRSRCDEATITCPSHRNSASPARHSFPGHWCRHMLLGCRSLWNLDVVRSRERQATATKFTRMAMAMVVLLASIRISTFSQTLQCCGL
jgi:hypothetical protein